MRGSAILIVLVGALLVHAGEPMRVDGVPVYGQVHDVSRADISEAIKAHGDEPAAQIEVVSDREMHIYYRSRELGWIPAYRTQATYGSPKLAWSSGWWGIRDTPKALQFIRTAKDVYIFPVNFTRVRSSVHNAHWLVPHRDDKHLRAIEPEARREVVRLLGRQESWFQGFDDRISIGGEPTNVGFLFRKGKDELVLFFSSGGMMEGAFKGQRTGGSLEDKQEQQMERWKAKYGQRELSTEYGLTNR